MRPTPQTLDRRSLDDTPPDPVVSTVQAPPPQDRAGRPRPSGGTTQPEGEASNPSSASRPRPPHAEAGRGPTHPIYDSGDHVRLTTRINDIPADTPGVITKVAHWHNGPAYEVRVTVSGGRRWIWCRPPQLTPDHPTRGHHGP